MPASSSRGDRTPVDDTPRPTNAETGPSSTNSSPSMLPYLRDSNPSSPQTDVPAAAEGARVPAPRPGPAISLLKQLQSNATSTSSGSGSGSGPDSSSSPIPTPTPLSAIPTPTPTSASSSSSSSKTKRRPKPLILGRQEIGQDEELTAQLQTDGRWSARSGISIISPTREPATPASPMDMSKAIADLSLLRKDVDANLSQRPVDVDSPSSHSSSEVSPFSVPIPLPAMDEEHQVDITQLINQTGHVVIDTRPLGSFLTSHLPRSININIPTLIYKRLKRSRGIGATPETLGGYITTSAGRTIWEEFVDQPDTDVVIVGQTDHDEASHVYKDILDRIGRPDRVKVLRGGWPAVLASEAVLSLVIGDGSPNPSAFPPSNSSSSFKGPIPTFNIAPPPIPDSTPSQGLSQKQSMPSLRAGIKRNNIPSLSIQVDPSRRPGQMAPKSASAASGGKFPNLHLDIAATKGAPGSLAPKSPGRSPIRGSFQQACLEQSKLPPSPSSFADITLPTPGPTMHSQFAGPSRTGPARNAVAPFIVSTILPNFLYLGPEINSAGEVEELKKMGIKRILNVAVECHDGHGLGLDKEFERYHKIPMRDIVEETGVNKYMREACDFLNDARLHSAPVYVHCKAGKSRSVTVVLAYLIHANAWTLKTAYAHVAEHRKGISPNIGFVAELMQFEETELGLKQSAGVHGDVPQPEDNSVNSKNDDLSSASKGNTKPSPRKQKYSRESLPPAWAVGSASLGNPVPRLLVNNNDVSPTEGGPRRGSQVEMVERGKDRKVTDEREVRKDGHWVQQRRAPADRTTLQPGRRASKAGLESLRHLPSPLPAGDGVPGITISTSPDTDPTDESDTRGNEQVTRDGGSRSAI